MADDEVEHDLDERLDESKRNRARMLQRFGFIPSSVLKLSRGALSASLFNMAKETPGRSVGGASSVSREQLKITENGRAVAEERRRRGIFGAVAEVAHKSNKTTLSIMAGELVEFTIRYYCPPAGHYLDPFAGHGVRAQVASRMGVTYQGCDLSAEFVGYTTAALERTNGAPAEVRICDARTPYFDDNTGDFSFTSPPYWDIEYYGPHPDQLGTNHTYDEFLDGMKDVYTALRPKMKTGAWVVVNINDIRRDKTFIPYHADLQRIVSSIDGYALHDIWILQGLVSGLPRAFAVDFNQKRIAPKSHEYLLVFRCV